MGSTKRRILVLTCRVCRDQLGIIVDDDGSIQEKHPELFCFNCWITTKPNVNDAWKQIQMMKEI